MKKKKNSTLAGSYFNDTYHHIALLYFPLNDFSIKFPIEMTEMKMNGMYMKELNFRWYSNIPNEFTFILVSVSYKSDNWLRKKCN